jgi:hypothetical protein
MPVSNCGLKLNDEAVRVAVGLQLGLNLCLPHSCLCGTLGDADGLHAFVCKQASNRTKRHWALNYIIWRASTSAGIPAIKEPPGLARTVGKRPDGLSLIPWHGGKSVIWDVTVVCALANSYVKLAARELERLPSTRQQINLTSIAHYRHATLSNQLPLITLIQ